MRHRHPLALLALTLALLGLGGALAGCGASAGAAADTKAGARFTLRVGYISANAKVGGPEGWAARDGSLLAALRPVGVDAITWAPFPNGPELAAAMRGGSLDLGVFGDTPAIVAKAAGLDARLINQSRINLDTWVFTPKTGGPRTLADLAGKTVATQTGSYMYRFLLGALSQQGLIGKVRVTNIYTPNAAAALLRGDIAAYAAPAQVAPQLAAKGLPVIDKASTDHHDLYGTSVTLAAGRAVAAHPALVAAWNNARAAAIKDIGARLDDYYTFEAGVLNVPKQSLPAIEPLAAYPAEPFTPAGLALLSATATFLHEQKLATSRVDVAAWRAAS